MKERPILFSAPMVRAILDGSKTQTRRIAKPWSSSAKNAPVPADLAYLPDFTSYRATCPRGQPGDRLWVRETFSGPHHQELFSPSLWHSMDEIWYWADGSPVQGDWTRPRPSIHMPRWASRINLEVTGVRVERLQDISEADARAEGVLWDAMGWMDYSHDDGRRKSSSRQSYQTLWESINGAGSWDANPWVWVIEFRRIEHQVLRQAA